MTANVLSIIYHMSYNQKHTQIISPEEWYNRIATEYGQYHEHLDWFYQDIDIARFVPKDPTATFLDLGAGDGRMFKQLKNVPFDRFIACDVSQKLLQLHPNQAEKILCDLEEDLPFDEGEIDVITSFFVLEHIQNIQELFNECYRILKPWGRRIIGHFIQRRAFLREKDAEKFKIQQYTHRIEDLEQYANEAFFNFHKIDVVEKGTLLGWIILLDK